MYSDKVSKSDLGIYFTATGSKAAVYKQNVITASVQLKAGHTYLLLGKNGVSVSFDGPMSSSFVTLTSDEAYCFNFNESRTSMLNGGGCIIAMLVATKKDCTVNLRGYGYVNETYNYEGKIIALQLA